MFGDGSGLFAGCSVVIAGCSVVVRWSSLVVRRLFAPSGRPSATSSRLIGRPGTPSGAGGGLRPHLRGRLLSDCTAGRATGSRLRRIPGGGRSAPPNPRGALHQRQPREVIGGGGVVAHPSRSGGASWLPEPTTRYSVLRPRERSAGGFPHAGGDSSTAGHVRWPPFEPSWHERISTTRYSVSSLLHAPRCKRQLPALSRPLHHGAMPATEAAPPTTDEAPGAASGLVVQPPQEVAAIRAPCPLRHAIAYRRHAIALSFGRSAVKAER